MIEVPYRTSGGCSWVPIESYLLSTRRIFINKEITAETADLFVQKLLYLVREDKEGGIDIYIDSPGGEVTAGLLIYDMLKSLPAECRVTCTCTGMASSMAAIILAGGPRGNRFILPHSMVMIHEPLIQGGVGGSATSVQKTAESIMNTKRHIAGLLSADTGKSIEEVEAAISFDNYMRAEEALSFGIVDQIIPSILSMNSFKQ